LSATSGQSTDLPRPPRRRVDGLLLLDKPSGITSNGALQRVKWLFGARKAGHTGSLDPLASGMLPLCFGEATKFAGYLLDSDKTYRVRLQFGVQTDTGDADGAVVATAGHRAVERPDLEVAVAGMLGPMDQVPPMYSALKQGGQRLYALARAGQTVERPSRPVRIHSLAIETYDPEAPTLVVRCSKGTYVRVLVEDLAARLGTVAHVTLLRRLEVSTFAENRMWTLPDVLAASERGPEALSSLLLPVESILGNWPALRLDAGMATGLAQGRAMDLAGPANNGLVRLYGPQDRFLGLGEVLDGRRVAVRRLLSQGDTTGSSRRGVSGTDTRVE
jgi:tRNA pseudouridine55 synthase